MRVLPRTSPASMPCDGASKSLGRFALLGAGLIVSVLSSAQLEAGFCTASVENSGTGSVAVRNVSTDQSARELFRFTALDSADPVVPPLSRENAFTFSSEVSPLLPGNVSTVSMTGWNFGGPLDTARTDSSANAPAPLLIPLPSAATSGAYGLLVLAVLAGARRLRKFA